MHVKMRHKSCRETDILGQRKATIINLISMTYGACVALHDTITVFIYSSPVTALSSPFRIFQSFLFIFVAVNA